MVSVMNNYFHLFPFSAIEFEVVHVRSTRNFSYTDMQEDDDAHKNS